MESQKARFYIMDLRGAGEFAFANARHADKSARNDAIVESWICENRLLRPFASLIPCNDEKTSNNDKATLQQ